MAETELVIDHIGARGDGLALIEGRRVALPFTLPGERLRAKVAGDRGDGICRNTPLRTRGGRVNAQRAHTSAAPRKLVSGFRNRQCTNSRP